MLAVVVAQCALNVAVAGSELVGLIPLEAVLMAAEYYVEREGLFLLDERQKVRGDLFTSDSLHMNAEGYRIWKDHLRAVLKEECGY